MALMPLCHTVSHPVIVNIFLMTGQIRHTYMVAISTVKTAMACSPTINIVYQDWLGQVSGGDLGLFNKAFINEVSSCSTIHHSICVDFF